MLHEFRKVQKIFLVKLRTKCCVTREEGDTQDLPQAASTPSCSSQSRCCVTLWEGNNNNNRSTVIAIVARSTTKSPSAPSWSLQNLYLFKFDDISLNVTLHGFEGSSDTI